MADRPAPLLERVDVVFASEGPLARALDGFEPREGQRQLAAAVARTFEEGGLLVAEAGTGTGKTLAYLVPAVLAGRRVLISTGTRTLQDQIFYKDVPALSRALGAPIRAAYMKGRTNYLCRHRLERLTEAASGLSADERGWLNEIRAWADVTETGDRAEIDALPDDAPVWTELSATSEQCLGRDCAHFADCFITKMRDAAAAADVVIVNHHLLCADAAVRQSEFGEVIPECDVAVIDEAHQIEDIVTQYFGVSLGSHRIDEFCRDAAGGIGVIEADDAKFAVEVSRALSEVQRTARRLFDAARAEVRADANDPFGEGPRRLAGGGGGDRVTVTADVAARLHPSSGDLGRALDGVVSVLRRRAELPAEMGAIAVRASALGDDLAQLLAADDGRSVRFVEARGRGVSLRSAPIDVAEIVRASLFAPRAATVLTSATLSVEGSFDYTLSRLGAEGARTVRLASEFDYRKQAILFLPQDMPDPRAPEFNRAAAWRIAELLDHTRGRAFALFTSYAAMREVFALVEKRVSWPLLIQGSAPRSALLRDFRATPNAVLFATASFWQGVDVAGDALSAVIVDRLPFASPADPLMAARLAAIRARGGDPFRDYQVPLAILTLLQGLGRLIRTRTDRGLLAVLDPRLTRMGYGRRFLASFPPAPLTGGLDDVERFFAGEAC